MANDDWDDDDDGVDALVVDNGSAYIKAGLSGIDEEGAAPPCVFESCVARPHMVPDLKGRLADLHESYYVGCEGQEKRGICTLDWPIHDGVVQNWEEMEKIWSHMVDRELQMTMEDCCGVILTEPALNPIKSRQRAMETWMEVMDAPNYFVALGSYLALMQMGRQTGLCVDSGDGVTTLLPMANSTILSDAMMRIPLGGRDCTRLMERLLIESSCYLNTSAERMTVMEMKKECYVADDFEAEMAKFDDGSKAAKQFALPDAQLVQLSAEMIQVPELMFNPSKYGREVLPLHQQLQRCVESCPLDTRAGLLSSVMLCGGNTMFPNMPERLQAEVRGLVDPEWEETLVQYRKAKVIVSYPKDNESYSIKHQMYAAWTGGCVLAQLDNFKTECWISKAEYDEKGPSGTYDQIRCFTLNQPGFDLPANLNCTDENAEPAPFPEPKVGQPE